jgi:hypothetical protein
LEIIHLKKKLPEHIDPEKINEYLVALARDPKSPSRSSFKHMVYMVFATITADVVQHKLIAGSCRPLRVLFIVFRALL